MNPGERSPVNGSSSIMASGSGATADQALYGRQIADLYDHWYGLRSVDAGIWDFLTEHSGGGTALEIGVGTGRIALGLEARGVTVVGVDISTHMLAHCRRNSPTMPLITMDATQIGDLANLRPRLIYCTMGTFFQLGDRGQQLQVLAAAACCAASGSHLVVDAWQLPANGPELPTVDVTDQIVGQEHLRQITVHDADARTVDYWQLLHQPGIAMHVVHRRDHYLDAHELETLAASCGWQLIEQYADFLRHPLRPTSHSYVEVFRLMGTA